MIVEALLGYKKGNRGFQDFETWQNLRQISKYLFGEDTQFSVDEFFESKTKAIENDEYKWDIQKNN